MSLEAGSEKTVKLSNATMHMVRRVLDTVLVQLGGCDCAWDKASDPAYMASSRRLKSNHRLFLLLRPRITRAISFPCLH